MPSGTPLPRDEFPIADHLAYLNHAAIAPLPRVCTEAQTRANEAWAAEASLAYQRYDEHAQHVRGRAATLMGVESDGVAFVKNTTEGLAFVAGGIDWQAGDRVIVPSREFPSTLYPFSSLEDLGVEVVRPEPTGRTEVLPLEVFERELLAAPTRMVVCSWVQYRRGWRVDPAELAQLCHRHGALLCLDVIQGLGLLPARLAEWGVDFAMADAHKWLLGPQGIGLFYVAPEHREQLRVLEPGWSSVAHRDDFDHLELVLDPSSRRFEGGTQNLTGVAGMGASIELILSTGVDRIWTHVHGLCDRAASGLADAGAEVLSDRGAGRSGIVTFSLPGHDAEAVQELLRDRSIVVSPRGGGVRISPHGYNTEEEIDELTATVRQLIHP